MARLWSSGFELNDLTKEFNGGTAGPPTISTTTKRSGSYAMQTNAANRYGIHIIDSSSKTTLYVRAYIYIASLPGGTTAIIKMQNGSGGSGSLWLRLTTAGKLQLWNGFANNQVGSDSTITLATGTWYRVEMKYTSANCELKVDGAVEISAAPSGGITAPDRVQFGPTDSGPDMYWDDLAINDTTGTIQNAYPGDGKIVHVRPNAAGDNNQWPTATGGSAGTSNNYGRVNEVAPDDATTMNATTTTGHIDDYNLDSAASAGIGSNDTITLVAIGARWRTQDSNFSKLILRIKASSGGTVEESAALKLQTGNVFITNMETSATASPPYGYKLTLYDLPGASTTVWTPADLDSAQIGIKSSITFSSAVEVSTMWLLVEYVPTAIVPNQPQAMYVPPIGIKKQFIGY